MKNKIKTLIISIISLGVMSLSTLPALSFDFKIFNKKDKAQDAKIEQKVVESNAQSEVQVDVKTVKPKKIKKVKVKKEKPAKYDDQTVTAKTDKNKQSVKIIIKDEQKAKKEPKISHKHFKKPKTSGTKDKNVISEEKPVPKQLQTDSQNDDIFSATPQVQGSVSANHIISVDDCVKIALENNPSILSQLISKDIYKNKIAQAWSNYFPTISAGLSYSKNDMLMTNFKFPMQKYTLWNTPQVGVNWTLYDFGKTGAQAGIARKTYEASRDTLQSNINEVVYQVKNAYYNQLYLQQQVEVYEDSVLQYQIHLKQAQAYYAIGSKAKIDVSTAAYNLDNAKLTLVQSKNAVDSGFAQLTNSMGIPEFAPFTIKDSLEKKRYDITFDESLKIAYDQNPSLLAAKKKMEGSKLLIKSTKVAFLPDIQAFGNYTNGGKKPGDDYGYQIGGQLSYSNINLYLLKKQVDEAKLTYKKDQADFEIQRQKIYLDVKQAYIRLKNAQQSIPVARASMNVAKERYQLAAGRYKVGLGDAIELKDAQNTYMTAKLQYYNTLTDYHISAANLERVIGAPLSASDVSL